MSILAGVVFLSIHGQVLALRSSSSKAKAASAAPHWSYDPEASMQYTFTAEWCRDIADNEDDCNKTAACGDSDMEHWTWITNTGEAQPRLTAARFRRTMANTRVLFIGDSAMRQQTLALAMTLGLTSANRNAYTIPHPDWCSTATHCMEDPAANITFCHQFAGSFATKIYRSGNYTFNHSRRGPGDSSCILSTEMLSEFAKFDVVLVQSQMWWGRDGFKRLVSEECPASFLEEILPTVYGDSMRALLTPLSLSATAALVLGHIGVSCSGRRRPDDSVAEVPDQYGWREIRRFWTDGPQVVREAGLGVQVVDVRAPLMSSVHAHVSSSGTWFKDDCFHFCMNSVAVSAPLDHYQVKLFDKFSDNSFMARKRMTPAQSRPDPDHVRRVDRDLAALGDECDFIECVRENPAAS